MDVFEFAMKMEKDGEAFYRSMASQAGNAALKNVLIDLAEDEVKHYQIFKRFSGGDFSGGADLQAAGTKIMARAKNIFQQMSTQKSQASFGADVITAWKEAQRIEKKSEDFYREKAAASDNEKVRKTLNLIADEEHKHWALIEHVLEFLNRPKQWLEDAEWNHLDKY